MSYTFTTLDEGHILILTLNDDFDVHTQKTQFMFDALDRIDAGPDRMVFITDSRNLPIRNVNDMLVASSNVRTEEAKRLMHHPKLVKSYTVINNKIFQKVIKGLNSTTFGYFEITVFETVEEAIEAGRKVLAEEHSI